MRDLDQMTCFSMGMLTIVYKLYGAPCFDGFIHIVIYYRIMKYIYPKMLENNNTVQAEGNVTLKAFIGAKVEYLGTAFGTDDTFSTSVVMCHTLNYSDASPVGSEPYLVILPRPQRVIQDSSEFLLTVYGVQYLSTAGRTKRYAIKKKEIHGTERRVTMDIHMKENNGMFVDRGALMEANDVLIMQRMFKETNEHSQCCDGAKCGSMMPFHDEKSSEWPANKTRESASWFQGWPTLCVLSATALYFYSRAIIWFYMMAHRDKDSCSTSPSKGWVRDDQQGRLCRTS